MVVFHAILRNEREGPHIDTTPQEAHEERGSQQPPIPKGLGCGCSKETHHEHLQNSAQPKNLPDAEVTLTTKTRTVVPFQQRLQKKKKKTKEYQHLTQTFAFES